MLVQLDDALIDYIFQPVANRLYWATDERINHFKIARFWLIVTTIDFFVFGAMTWKQSSLIMALSLLSAITTLGQCQIWKVCESIRPGISPERTSDWYKLIRLSLVVILSITLYYELRTKLYIEDILLTGLLLFGTISYYFSACNWPPPPERKTKIMFASI